MNRGHVADPELIRGLSHCSVCVSRGYLEVSLEEYGIHTRKHARAQTGGRTDRDRQTQADKQAETDRQKDRQTDTHTHTHTHTHTNVRIQTLVINKRRLARPVFLDC